MWHTREVLMTCSALPGNKTPALMVPNHEMSHKQLSNAHTHTHTHRTHTQTLTYTYKCIHTQISTHMFSLSLSHTHTHTHTHHTLPFSVPFPLSSQQPFGGLDPLQTLGEY